MFECYKCQKILKTRYYLIRHLEITHSFERPLECKICYSRFKCKVSLKCHARVHQSEKPYKCDFEGCGKSFKAETIMNTHKKLHSNSEYTQNPHECIKCGRRMKTLANLKSHLKRHDTPKTFKCYECGWGFVTDVELRDHLTVHSDEKPFKCSKCDRRFKKAGDVKVHLISHLSTQEKDAIKKHQCDLCGLKFRQHYEIVNHIRRHTQKSFFRCHKCSKCFKTKYAVKNHEFRIHQDIRNFKCKECELRWNL